MNRLRAELQRLYGFSAETVDADGDGPAPPQGVRAAVLAVVLPAGWAQLGPVWRGVQTDLELPAPAIAVSGVDALQLWFSFASPTAPAAVLRFLKALGARYLAGVKPAQWRTFDAAATLPAPPFAEVEPQRWSAFITHDLASVFDDTPWLDLPPTDDGQGALLHGLQPIRPAAFDAALSVLGVGDSDAAGEPASDASAAVPATGSNARIASTALTASASSNPSAAPTESSATTHAALPPSDPARFLSKVMNDETAPLALRIEAARILLSHTPHVERDDAPR